MSKIYLAGPYSERLTLARYKWELLTDGHAVTSRWIDGNHPYGDNPKEAQADLDDVQACDTLILFTDGDSPGGRHVEMGYALARGKLVYLVGSQSNLFHTLAAARFPDWESCRQSLYLSKFSWLED